MRHWGARGLLPGWAAACKTLKKRPIDADHLVKRGRCVCVWPLFGPYATDEAAWASGCRLCVCV